jgi:YHS domain-containing protein
VPPSIRFKEVIFMYQMVGLPEQPIDPITGTRTCGAFDWTIGGQVYHFCSIPTLEEFVARAKRDPKSILPTTAYVYHSPLSRVASR